MLTNDLSPVLIQTPTFEVKIATHLHEIESAFRLRFEVFNLEMHEGLESSYQTGFDSDVYDTFCDHLIVTDKRNGMVVGTYRLLRQEKAEKNIGYYSECEFNLKKLKMLSGRSLEVGRSCVAREYRSAAVINLLWAAIARYMEMYRINRLFGCASLHTKDRQEIFLLTAFLLQNHLASESYRVFPLPQHMMKFSEAESADQEIRSAFRLLPPLLKGYLRLGAVICGEPAQDNEFGTVDFLILVENDKISDRYKKHYCQNSTLQ